MRLQSAVRNVLAVPRRLRNWLRQFRDRRPESDRVQRLDEQLVSSLACRRVPTGSQLKLLPRLLSLREKLLATGLLIVFLTAGGFLVLRLIGRFSTATPASGGSYVEGVIGAPQYLNPIFASGNDADDDLIKLAFAGLFRYDVNHAVVPDLAESFSVNPEATEYTVTLKSNLLWSDGQPLTVDDAIFTFGLLRDSRFKSPLSAAFNTITVERADDRRIKFTLKKPLALFLSSLTVGILPEHKWQDVQPSNARLNRLNLEPVGAGPYRVREFNYDASGNVRLYRLEPNPYYQGPAAEIRDLTLRFYPDPLSAIEALRSKKVDGLNYLPPDDQQAVDRSDARIERLRLPRYTAVFFNEKRRGLKDASLREALAVAIDRPALAREVTNGTAQVIDGPLPQGFPGSSPAQLVRPFDPSRANELLDKAGWTKGDDGFRHKGGETLTIGLTTSDFADYTSAAERIKRGWEAVGVKTEVTIVPANRIARDAIQARNYDTILFSQVLGAELDPFPFWHSSQEHDQGLNLSVYYNKEIDKLLEDARTTQSLDERTKKYAEFQQRLNEQLPAIFLYQPNYLYVLPKKIKGFRQTSVYEAADRLSDITNWYIKTKRRFR